MTQPFGQLAAGGFTLLAHNWPRQHREAQPDSSCKDGKAGSSDKKQHKHIYISLLAHIHTSIFQTSSRSFPSIFHVSQLFSSHFPSFRHVPFTARTHAGTRAQAHTRARTRAHARTPTHARTHTQAHTHTHQTHAQHTPTHPRTRSRTHHTHTRAHALARHASAYTHAHPPSLPPTHPPTHPRARAHARTQARARTHAKARTHARKHAHVRARARTPGPVATQNACQNQTVSWAFCSKSLHFHVFSGVSRLQQDAAWKAAPSNITSITRITRITGARPQT